MKKTLVLVHGWGTSNYNSNIPKGSPASITWKERAKLVGLLQEKYNLLFYNHTGFGGEPEPKQKTYNLDDFTNHFNSWLVRHNTKPIAIVGYSFGGAVALNYKAKFNSPIPVILISPALKRKETLKSFIAKVSKQAIPVKYLKELKHLYQSLFSKYYSLGTPFLQSSYDKVVREDLRPLLKVVNPKELLLVYGQFDNSTPVSLVTKQVKEHNLNLKIIKNGDHEIGQTHPKQVFSIISNFIKKSLSDKT